MRLPDVLCFQRLDGRIQEVHIDGVKIEAPTEFTEHQSTAKDLTQVTVTMYVRSVKREVVDGE